MKTLNSQKSKAGKAEIISFILLALISAAVVIYWRYQESGHNEKHSLMTIPVESKGISKIQNIESKMNSEPVVASMQKMTTNEKPVPHQKPIENVNVADKTYIDNVDDNADILDTKAAEIKEEVKPLAAIVPPLPAYDIHLIENVVNANSGELITTKRNSRINIPPNAFVDATGKIVNGSVTVSYREYHDFHDIFLSGIPMQYEKGMLESAGMIEIRASQNGESLYVNPENKISVMLASASTDKDYNLYFLDQKEMKWKQSGANEITLTTKARTVQQGPAALDSMERKFNFQPLRYRLEMSCLTDMYGRKKHWFSRKGLTYVFDFRLLRTLRVPDELKELSKIKWRYYGEDAQQVYIGLFGSIRKAYKRAPDFKRFVGYAYVTKDPDSSSKSYQFNLVLDGIAMSIPVTPVFSSRREAKNFSDRWKKYSEAYAIAKEKESIRFENFQADTAVYFASNPRYRYLGAEELALRTFAINDFGIWNCDRPIPKMPATVVAKFTDEMGNPLNIENGYLVVKSQNSVYPVNDFNKFPFDRKAQTLFWAILPGNKLAVVYPKEFAKHITVGGECTFTVQIKPTALDNITNLISALDFN